MFHQTLDKVSTQRFLRITAEKVRQRHPTSVSDWLLFPARASLVCRAGNCWVKMSDLDQTWKAI